MVAGWQPHCQSESYLDRTIKVWDAATGGFLFQLRNFTSFFAVFSPSGNQIFTNDWNKHGHAYIWELPTSAPTLLGINAPQWYGAWSPDGTLIAAGGFAGVFHIFDASIQQELMAIPGAGWGHWSPDSTRFFTSTGPESFSVYDVKTGDELFHLSVPGVFGLTTGWSPDGAYIAGAGWQREDVFNVYIWNAKTGEPFLTLHMDNTHCMAWWPTWSPDSSKIVTGCMLHEEPGANAPARIWDAATGEELKELESKYGWTLRAVWSPDGTRLLTSYEKGVARIWDAESGEVLLTYAGHLDQVWAAAWSPDGTRVASGDLTGLVKIWDAETGEEFWEFRRTG